MVKLSPSSGPVLSMLLTASACFPAMPEQPVTERPGSLSVDLSDASGERQALEVSLENEAKLARDLFYLVLYEKSNEGVFSDKQSTQYIKLDPEGTQKWEAIERTWTVNNIPECGRAEIRAVLVPDNTKVNIERESALLIECSEGPIAHFVDDGIDGVVNFAGSLDDVSSMYHKHHGHTLNLHLKEGVQQAYINKIVALLVKGENSEESVEVEYVTRR